MAETLETRTPPDQTLGVRAAQTLTYHTKTVPQMEAVSPRWLLRFLPWVHVSGGAYQVNHRKQVVRDRRRVRVSVEGDKGRIDPGELRGTSLFRGVDDRLLEVVARLLREERHAANQELYREGDPAGKLFFIVEGKVEITSTDRHGEKLRVAIAGDGDYFGENALRPDWIRQTTVRTLVPSRFLILDRAALIKAITDDALRADLERLTAPSASGGLRTNDAGEAGIDITSYKEGEPVLRRTFVDYEEVPRIHELSVTQTVIRIHTRITDLYNHPMDQLREQLRLTIEGMKERQESEIVNDPSFGLLHAASPAMRIRTRSGPPTPDDLDDLLAHVWKEPAYFVAHPRAIAAFGRECTRRGVPPPTVQIFGSPFLTWRGVPLVPCDKVSIRGQGAHRTAGLTSILLMRVGEERQGVVGLDQVGIHGEQLPGLSVRFMGIDAQSMASYLVTMYYSAAVLTEDALAILEDVEVGKYHDYGGR